MSKLQSEFMGRIFSVDSPKAIKASKYGYLNAILYMAPHATAGVGNLCPAASAGCMSLCLGTHSGQASMVADLQNGMNPARASRQAKARAFMRDRVRFVRRVAVAIAEAHRQATREGLALCVRLNGATDIGWEGVGLDVDAETSAAISKASNGLLQVGEGRFRNLMAAFPSVQFVDYTKVSDRFRRPLPANYHLTFSRSERNETQAADLLARGVNVAAVFANGLPEAYLGARVVDGDSHDLRHLDPRESRGVIIGLTPKGLTAKRDTSGFVVRDYALAA